jgi:hypothetical protein
MFQNGSRAVLALLAIELKDARAKYENTCGVDDA